MTAKPATFGYTHEQAEVLLCAVEVKLPGVLAVLEAALRQADMWPQEYVHHVSDQHYTWEDQ